jgi:hypothetical protein
MPVLPRLTCVMRSMDDLRSRQRCLHGLSHVQPLARRKHGDHQLPVQGRMDRTGACSLVKLPHSRHVPTSFRSVCRMAPLARRALFRHGNPPSDRWPAPPALRCQRPSPLPLSKRNVRDLPVSRVVLAALKFVVLPCSVGICLPGSSGPNGGRNCSSVLAADF